ncbi:MAG: hypothetical protein M3Y81_21445 [Chloroflexota bacterium]|nr:hypothetical protein [Chloroflexota bacterium]
MGHKTRQNAARTRFFSVALVILAALLLSNCGGALKTTQRRTLPGIDKETHITQRWTWATSLPGHRLVIFYGNPYSAVMGPIGRYTDNELIARLSTQAQAYDTLDPTHPTVPALDYVTPIAQGSPMSDRSWVARMPAASIEHYLNLANDHQALFFFDMQIGHSPIQKEVNLLWPYLQRPGVDLSLDPEFDMAPGAVPGREFGRMPAAEINWVIDQLSELVRTQHLPPKILIIHQFLMQMLPDWQKIQLKPGVQVITCVDGFGSPAAKTADYRIFDQRQLIQYPGMKMFYALDKPLMAPAQVLALRPVPLMVMYQ